MNLLESVYRSDFYTVEKRAFKKGIGLCFAFAVDRFIAVGKPLNEGADLLLGKLCASSIT